MEHAGACIPGRVLGSWLGSLGSQCCCCLVLCGVIFVREMAQGNGSVIGEIRAWVSG